MRTSAGSRNKDRGQNKVKACSQARPLWPVDNMSKQDVYLRSKIGITGVVLIWVMLFWWTFRFKLRLVSKLTAPHHVNTRIMCGNLL